MLMLEDALSMEGRYMKTYLFKTSLLLTLLAVVVCFMSAPAMAAGKLGGANFACTATARAADKACKHEAEDDFWIAVGNCHNLSDPAESWECKKDAFQEFMEVRGECSDQKEARLEICDELGEAPYDPMIDPEEFVDFEAIIDGAEDLDPNPYFPLIPGYEWEYLAKDSEDNVLERIRVQVLDEFVEILGVNCIVVRDRVWEIDDGEEILIEDTDDWYAQDIFGNVWYFGEISKNYEDGELDNLDGSWKAGKDSAKAGILMFANPEEDTLYRQEFFLGDAEDMARVVSVGDASVTVPFGGTYDVDVLQTEEFTPIEPDVLEFKYYAPGVGMVLEENPEDEERVELVDMITP